MEKRIIYPIDGGGVAVIIPAPDARNRVLVSAEVIEKFTVHVEAVTGPVMVHPDDGGAPFEAVAVIEPAHDITDARLVSPAVWRDETDDEFLARIAAKDVPAGLPFMVIDAAEIPEDRTFRAAWEYPA